MLRVVNGYYIWNKHHGVSLSPHFSASEFECQCSYMDCDEQRISILLVTNLEALRRDGGPLQVTSGFRCRKHQRDLASSGTVETVPVGALSEHELGNAADVKPLKDLVGVLLDKAKKYFKAIGIAQHFLHLDTRSDKERRWYYRN